MTEDKTNDVKFAKKAVIFDEFKVGVEFCKHNRDELLGELPNNHPCVKEGNIFERMSTYFILPLLKDMLTWVFEFLRNLVNFGYMECLYIVTFYFYLSSYSIYSEQFHGMMMFMTTVSDSLLYIPLIAAQIVHTWENSGKSILLPLLYTIICYLIIFAPRLILIMVENVKNGLWTFSVSTVKTEKLIYGVICAYTVFLAVPSILTIYSTGFRMLPDSFTMLETTDLYIRECIAGLISFLIIRIIFLYSECFMDRTPYKKKNLLSCEEDAAKLRRVLLLFMVYTTFCIGSVAFMYTYYSFQRAATDTKIVEDIRCINYAATRVMSDPVSIVASLAKKTFKDFWSDIKNVASSAWDATKNSISYALSSAGRLFSRLGKV
ncbi:hypothetical protein NEAUS03_1253 [Nematocida ausubeli]|nr:hypothetical protein NEAUS03_1253 [Nematocida ausubeli]